MIISLALLIWGALKFDLGSASEMKLHAVGVGLWGGWGGASANDVRLDVHLRSSTMHTHAFESLQNSIQGNGLQVFDTWTEMEESVSST